LPFRNMLPQNLFSALLVVRNPHIAAFFCKNCWFPPFFCVTDQRTRSHFPILRRVISIFTWTPRSIPFPSGFLFSCFFSRDFFPVVEDGCSGPRPSASLREFSLLIRVLPPLVSCSGVGGLFVVAPPLLSFFRHVGTLCHK